MDRQSLIARFVALAIEIEVHSLEVAKAILAIVEGKENIPYTWLVRWNRKGNAWRNDSTAPERIRGHAWVLAGCGEWQKKLPFIIPENATFQELWVKEVEPLNRGDLEEAKRARELGLDVNVQPKYTLPPAGQITTREGFEAVVRIARPVWRDDSVRGNVVVGHKPGYDDEGHPCDVPVYGKEVEHGPGFQVTGVPPEWVQTYSNLEAFSVDGSTRFYAPLSGGGGGPVKITHIPDDTEVVWRIPRELVIQLLGLMDEAGQLFKDEKTAREIVQNEAERNRLAAKFNLRK